MVKVPYKNNMVSTSIVKNKININYKPTQNNMVYVTIKIKFILATYLYEIMCVIISKAKKKK